MLAAMVRQTELRLELVDDAGKGASKDSLVTTIMPLCVPTLKVSRRNIEYRQNSTTKPNHAWGIIFCHIMVCPYPTPSRTYVVRVGINHSFNHHSTLNNRSMAPYCYPHQHRKQPHSTKYHCNRESISICFSHATTPDT